MRYMNKKKARVFRKRIIGLNPLYVSAVSLPLSLIFGADIFLALAISFTGYFSWSIFQVDIEEYKIGHFNLAGLLLGCVAMTFAGADFNVSILRAIIFFLIGWGMFQLFEGDIGGGDVRLVTVAALFLNVIQLLSAISLAAATGMLIASRLKMKRVPFGALLIVSFWLSFWIVRF
jgi:Flp pilus assembly protein protease CpaA